MMRLFVHTLSALAGTVFGLVVFVGMLMCVDALGLDFQSPDAVQNFAVAVGLILLQALAITVFAYRMGLQEGYLQATEDALERNPE